MTLSADISRKFNIFCYLIYFYKGQGTSFSTRIVGTDTRMSNLDIRMSRLDTRMSRLDIRVSKVILESGKTKTAENSRLCVAFRMFFSEFLFSKLTTGVGHTYVQATNIPIWLDIRMSNLGVGVGHTYDQADNRVWTYICPS